MVSEQLVFQQQTTKGFQYLIQKCYFNLATRYGRRISRQGLQQPTPVSIASPAVEETKDNSPTTTNSTTSYTKVLHLNLGTDNDNHPDTPTTVPTPSGNDSIESLSIGDTWASAHYSVADAKRSDTPSSATNTPRSVRDIVPKDISPKDTNIRSTVEKDLQQTFKYIRSPSSTDEDMDFQGLTRKYIDTEIERILQERNPSLLNLGGRVKQMD